MLASWTGVKLINILALYSFSRIISAGRQGCALVFVFGVRPLRQGFGRSPVTRFASGQPPVRSRASISSPAIFYGENGKAFRPKEAEKAEACWH